MQLPERIEIRKDVMGGKACVRGTRIAVYTLLNFLAAGDTPEVLMGYYPQLKIEDIQACLKYAAALAEEEAFVAS
jgi:uncharacterized protein (DUF433 family)